MDNGGRFRKCTVCGYGRGTTKEDVEEEGRMEEECEGGEKGGEDEMETNDLEVRFDVERRTGGV